MSGRTFVDTNVWVYAVDGAEPEKRRRAQEVLEPTPETDIVISAQVLGEFYVIVTGKLARTVPDNDALRMIEQMAALPVVPIDGRLVATAIAGSIEWQISYWDALIIAAAESAGCPTVVSEDLSHGARYGSVRVENPFPATRSVTR